MRENNSSPSFDASADAAWDELETALAERLRAMEPDEIAAVEALSATEMFGATAYVQFCAWGSDRGLMIRAEAVSNHYLDDTQLLSPMGERELESLGWERPTYAPQQEADSGSSNFYVDLLVDDAETLACMSVRALRRAYGVAHPAFLSADGILPPAPEEQAAPGEDEVTDVEDVPAVVVVDTPDALRAVTAEVLTELLGHAPHADADGDFLVASDHSAFWVVPSPDAPALDLSGVVVTDVADTALALLEVNRLNRRDPLVQHVLVDATVRAHLRVDCAPFIASHVRSEVVHFRLALDEATSTLAATLQAASADQARLRRKQAVLTLTELVRGEVSGDTPPILPGMVAEVCSREEATTAALLRSTQTQLTKVRRVLASGHGTVRDVRREEVLCRQRELLRQALHLVVADAASA